MFGDNLKKYREERGFSQSDIAKQLFVTRQCVSKWEKGVTQPDLQTLSRLGELLGVSVDELIKGEACAPRKKPETLNAVMFTANMLIAVFCAVAVLAVWRFMPPTIPAHWSGGVIDRYGSRNEIFMHYAVFAVFAALDAALFFAFRHISDRKAICIAHAVVALFQIGSIIFIIVLYAGYLNGVPSFITCLGADLIMCLSAVMHPVINRRNYLLGVRITETLNSEYVWNKANSLACYLFVGFSAVIIAVGLIWPFDLSYLLLTAYVIPSVAVVAYAKIISKKA